ncbi:hypothetical protein Tco_0638135 [Tanacetum coccineum]
MGDEHLNTIPETESDEVIKSSVKNLVPIPSESEVTSDNMCDVPFCDKNHFDDESDLMESLINQETLIVYSPKTDSLLEKFVGELAPISPRIHEADFDPEEDIRLDDQLFYDDTSSDDDSFEDIDYVKALPPDFELVSLEKVKDFDTEDGEIDTDILLTIKDDILCKKLQNINLLIAKIESLNDNPLLILFDIEEKNSGSTTVHADISLPEYDSFHFEIEPDQGELTRVVVEDISDNLTRELYVHVPNVLPTLPTLVDRLYLFLTYVIRLFLPYFTYPVESPFLLSSGSEDSIFDPGISAFHFSSLKPTTSHRSGTFIYVNVYPNILNEIPMESLSNEDVPEDNVKIYVNPLFEFDDEYISSDVNPLFDEVIEDIKSGDVDETECLLHHDHSTPKISVVSILKGFTDEPPLEENGDLFDLESKENEWKKILYDALIDDLMTEDKVFDPGIHKKFFSPTYDCPDFEDSHARGFVHRSNFRSQSIA